ncbi:MAG: hypothetical protein FJ096_01345 [Deltaproteobacteria bacterium]|nr:hypothetical protein [Deltaproteobacteria bacterium]
MNSSRMGVLALGLLGCAMKPSQAKAPTPEELGVAETGEADIASEEKALKPVIKSTAEVKNECCQQCVSGLAQDKTGDDPAKVPCADYTWVLKEECLAFFRKTPMTAAEAKGCAAAAPAPEAAK